MAIREIITIPDKRLRLKSERVEKIDTGIKKLVEDMFETMYEAPGIGLAAIQLGIAKRVVTMDLSKKEDEAKPLVFINPEITWSSEEKNTYEEGCLSIPEYYEEVERSAEVKVKYLDIDGKASRDHGQGPVRDLPAARDRSHQRRPVHRLSVEAQARPRHQEVHQGRQRSLQEEGGGVIGLAPRVHGHAGFRRAHTFGDRRRGA